MSEGFAAKRVFFSLTCAAARYCMKKLLFYQRAHPDQNISHSQAFPRNASCSLRPCARSAAAGPHICMLLPNRSCVSGDGRTCMRGKICRLSLNPIMTAFKSHPETLVRPGPGNTGDQVNSKLVTRPAIFCTCPMPAWVPGVSWSRFQLSRADRRS